MQLGDQCIINTVRLSVLLLLIGQETELMGQDSLSGVTLSVDLDQVTLQEALNHIRERSDFSFSYNPNQVDVAQSITYQAENLPLNRILDELLSPLGISYVVVERQIVLRPADSGRAPPKQVTLSGYIKDSSNGEALIGTAVLISELSKGTTANQYGFYSITVPPGKYTIQYSFIGYQVLEEEVDLRSSLTRDTHMQEEAPVLTAIVVTSLPASNVNDIQPGKSNLRPVQVEERPVLFGEEDVIKSLESIPGIKPHSEGSTFYYVRGGDRDQNLILLDDAPIYNPSHFLGLFSTIIPDAINDITIYKGQMPAALGGRLSSVMDIRTKKGNDQNLSIWGNTGFISSKIGIEGPIKKDYSSFLLSGRMSQVGWAFKLDNDNIEQVYFSDLTAKLNFKLNSNNSIFFSFYTGSDNFFETNNGIEWSNNAGTVRWTHLFNDRLFLRTTLAGSSYDYFLHTERSSRTRWKSHISNLSLKSDFSYFLDPDNELTFGLAISGYNINPGNLTSNGIPSPAIVSVRNSVESVLYGNHEIQLDEHWGISYGIRLSTWSNTGDSFEYVFDENRQVEDTLFYDRGDRYSPYFNAEPRLAVRFKVHEEASFKASFSRNVQNLNLISNSISPFTSLEVWLPSNINIKPQTSNQWGLAYAQQFPKKGFALEAELFYKEMDNQIDYEAHAETLLNPLIERELRFGQGESYGLELILQKNEGRLRGWTGYSYSRAKRKFDDVNGGRTFNAFFDRPHEFNLVAGYDLGLRWHLGLNYTYFTGAPFSSPVSFYNFNKLEVPVYDQKNNDRLPAYQRLDVAATLKLNKDPGTRFRHDLTFSIYNFFGRKNPIFINYHKTPGTEEREFDIPADLLIKNRVPSKTFLFELIPSITYNFKWQ